jgi:hypothetical protein
MVYRGRIKNGQIALDEPAQLPEGAEVTVEVVAAHPGQPTVWGKLLELAGTAEGLPADAARNHDHYLYGTPRKP